MFKITTQTIVKNEEKWIWFALMSVKDYVSELLVFDDNSTDNTWKIINSINDPKIKATRGIFTNSASIRNEQLMATKTDWFLLVDGDEVWNKGNIQTLVKYLEHCPANIDGVFVRTRNCVGDVFHYQPESAGKYRLDGRKGNFNMRAFRNKPRFKWGLDFPRETFFDNSNVAIDKQPDHIAFCDTYYWHMTFLPRSNVTAERKHRQITKIEAGIKVTNFAELPEVFFKTRPRIVFDPLGRRSLRYEVLAGLATPAKVLRRRIFVK